MNKLFTFFAALLCATTSWAGPILPGSGTKDDPYLIGSLKDWREFSIYVSNNYTPFDECYKLTADIGPINDINYIIGYLDHPFKGIFDGDGHTLTMDFDSDTYGYVSPFFNIYDATIKNLHVTGEVTAAEPYAAGLVQEVESYYGNTIENCRVSTKIICNATTSGECMIGGFVGSNPDMELNITGCVFDGQIIAPNLTGCAGFVGWNDADRRGNVNITDCVFAPTAVNVQGGMTFVRSSKYGEDEYGVEYVKISNSYYTTPLGDAQGKAVHTITGNEGVTVAMAGEPKAYNMSNITTYSGSAGLKYNDIIYGGNGDVISLNLSGSDYGYTSSTGKITGLTNPFALTMEDADAVVSASQASDFFIITTESELRSAVQTDGINIKLANDIQLSNTSTLSIPSGKMVTIDLGGYALDRKLTKRGEGGGQVITVRKGATLNLSNGTLKGGWGGNAGGIANEAGTANLTNVNITGCTGDDKGGAICNLSGGTLTMKGGSITGNTSFDKDDPTGGGGIFNAEGATATLTDVTVTGNQAKSKGGGGICNYGTLTLDGCTITGNTCGKNGGGIYNFSTATLNMKGKMTVTDNTSLNDVPNNLFLKTGAVIGVTGSLAGSSIGVNMESVTGTLTSGYITYNNGVPPATVLTPDLPQCMDISLVGNEAMLSYSNTVNYIERSWDEENSQVVSTVKTLTNKIGEYDIPKEGDYKEITSNNDWFPLGGYYNEGHEYYVVRGNVHRNTLNVKGQNVHLILCDGARLTLPGGILMYGNHNLYIHSQSYGPSMGKLVAQSGYGDYAAGIGSNCPETGNEDRTPGDLEIHGGDIYAKGGKWAAGIGGGYEQNGGRVTILGGKIEAHGSDDLGAGIGSGYYGKGGTIVIFDGTIEAHGGANAAGIGGGQFSNGGTLIIHGGDVRAYGGNDGAGIGGGWDGNGGSVTINGGNVYARGNGNGAGIGSGSESPAHGGVHGGTLTVTGGHVEAYGGEDAAGIGGGEDADGGTVTISGGYVYAKGSYGGAGIGGGEGGDGANVTITGGTVHASAGSGETGNRAIGPGYGSDAYGSLTIGDEMMVSSERLATAAERKNMCWYRTQARIEPCVHQDHTYTWSGTTKNDTHTEVCQYCTTPFVAEQHTFEGGICTVCNVEQTFGGGGTGVETMSDGRGKMSDAWYDLSGRKMANGKLPKGLYIHNGKKIVIGTK